MFKHEHLNFLLVIISCTLRSTKCKMDARVVGGDPARIEDYPHAVFLRMKCTQNWICGGSVLNQRLLLTAAHCVLNCDMEKNETKIEAFMGNEHLQRAQITRLITDYKIHEEYNDDSIENDIAIAKMQISIPLKGTIKRVIISKNWPCQDANPTFGFVAGWGMINESIPVRTLILMSVSQKMKPLELCDKLLGPLSPGMFCAGSTVSDDPRASRGDSGSALIFNNIYQIGIVSFKVKAYPALMVYTNITYYYRWIKTNAIKLYCRTKYKPNSIEDIWNK